MAYSYFDYWYEACLNNTRLKLKPKEKWSREQKGQAHSILGSIRRHFGMTEEELNAMLIFGFRNDPLGLSKPEAYADIQKQWAVAEEFRKWKINYASFITQQPSLLSAVSRFKDITAGNGEVDISCLK